MCECLWAPLAPDGAIATPAQLPPPPAATRASGLPERLSRGFSSRASFGGMSHDEIALMSGGGMGGGGWGYGGGGMDGADDDDGMDGAGVSAAELGSSCDARYAGGRFVDGRYELPELAADMKLWDGAFAMGWRVRESYKNSRAVGTWNYHDPSGVRFRTKTEALRAAGRDGDEDANRRSSWGDFGRGRGRGNGRGRGRGGGGGGGGGIAGLPVVSGEWEGTRIRLVFSRGGQDAP